MSTADKLQICRDSQRLCLAMLPWTEDKAYWQQQADTWADRIKKLEAQQ